MSIAGGFRNVEWNTIWFLLLLSCTAMQGLQSWERPGCHLRGHTRIISIPGCTPQFEITANFCYGRCESFAHPTSSEDLLLNPQQPITSVARCCDMDETVDITQTVQCWDGIQYLTFKSAKTCSCSQCKKD